MRRILFYYKFLQGFQVAGTHRKNDSIREKKKDVQANCIKKYNKNTVRLHL